MSFARKYKWEKINWSQTTGKIAARLGVALTQVSRARRIHAPQTVFVSRRHDWDKVDWQTPNKTLAGLLQTSPLVVCAARRRYAPQTIGKVRLKRAKGKYKQRGEG